MLWIRTLNLTSLVAADTIRHGFEVAVPDRRGYTQMACGRPLPVLILSAEEQLVLDRLTASAGVSPALKQRSRAILACAQGKTNVSVASETGLTGLTVGKWRSRFLATRLKGFEQERRGRPIAPFTLSPAEKIVLETWLRSPESPLGLAQRARVVLACAEGASNKAVALAAEVSEDAVGDWRSRFLLKRLKGIKPERLGRPVAPVVLSPDEQLILEAWSRSDQSPSALARRAVVVLACAAGKSNAEAAQETGLSVGSVGKLRRQFLALRLDGLEQKRRSVLVPDRAQQVRVGIAISLH